MGLGFSPLGWQSRGAGGDQSRHCAPVAARAATDLGRQCGSDLQFVLTVAAPRPGKSFVRSWGDGKDDPRHATALLLPLPLPIRPHCERPTKRAIPARTLLHKNIHWGAKKITSVQSVQEVFRLQAAWSHDLNTVAAFGLRESAISAKTATGLSKCSHEGAN